MKPSAIVLGEAGRGMRERNGGGVPNNVRFKVRLFRNVTMNQLIHN
jgi:hypothetical protein